MRVALGMPGRLRSERNKRSIERSSIAGSRAIIEGASPAPPALFSLAPIVIENDFQFLYNGRRADVEPPLSPGLASADSSGTRAPMTIARGSEAHERIERSGEREEDGPAAESFSQ
ncbi:MAG: hypothetical protein BGO98_20035 [Myxococcales bacterium 68-20]|nr:MAG: hypothetical protein BGO98_20035 [Myxococcales bacterium 68-20]